MTAHRATTAHQPTNTRTIMNLPIYMETRRDVPAEWLCDDVELDVWPASYDEQRALLGLPVAVAS